MDEEAEMEMQEASGQGHFLITSLSKSGEKNVLLG